MSQGLVLRDAGGDVIFDSTSVTWNLLDHQVIASGSAQTTFQVPHAGVIDTPEYAHLRFLVNTVPTDQSAIMCTVGAENSTSWWATGGTADTIVIILVR
jgi:hypothetical protein